MVNIQGFHTCKAEGGATFIQKSAPFLSQSNNRQWLTQGYYFWTDSELYAHEWGKNSISGDYVIVKCHIALKKNQLLDLVGSVSDQQHFSKLLAKFHEKLKRDRPSAGLPTVNSVISFYRKMAESDKKIFPYYAIKTVDQCKKRSISYTNGGEELLFLVTRQQLCLFEFAKSCVKSSEIVHPEDFI